VSPETGERGGAPLEWIAEDEFAVDGIEYACKPMHDYFESTATRFCLRKPPHLVRRLEQLLAETKPRTIVELGVFEGGSTGFIAQTTPVEKLITFDIERPCVALEQMIRAKELETIVRPHWEIDQADTERLRAIVREELGDTPIDLIIDDASHLLEPTRASFNALFPLLRPGGTYLLEDWAWAHGITNAWPRQTPLSVLVFELTLAVAHRPEALERLDIDRSWALVTRGPRDLDDSFDLLEHCGERGRQVLPPPGAGALPQQGIADAASEPPRSARSLMRRAIGRVGGPSQGGPGGPDVG